MLKKSVEESSLLFRMRLEVYLLSTVHLKADALPRFIKLLVLLLPKKT